MPPVNSAVFLSTSCCRLMLVILVFCDELAMLPGPPDSMEKLVLLEGFEDVVIGTAANGLKRGGDIVDGGDHDDGDFRVETAEPVKELDAIHLGHDHVAEDEVRRLLANKLLSGAAIAQSSAAVAAGLQHRGDNLPNGFFVVYNQDMSRWSTMVFLPSIIIWEVTRNMWDPCPVRK